MLNIVKNRRIFYAISLAVIIPGLIALVLWGLPLSPDFKGGTLLEIKFTQNIDKGQIVTIAKTKNLQVEQTSIQTTGEKTYLIRTNPLNDAQVSDLTLALKLKDPKITTLRKETIGPTIGEELLRKALIAVVIASILIVFYIAYAFRRVPKPASSWRFGVSAIVALLHDVLVLFGIFAILGHFFAVEIDALFVTAVLTVIGFSVHDTIVVFDRVRENLNKGTSTNFEDTVQSSIMQTLGRSLNTSLTVVLVLLALLLFGGESVRWFVAALLIGIISGTYSSIFNAAPLLVTWQNFVEGRSGKRKP
ncbi:MAG TPA: protein translocase subunit SecF [Candidatus Saccharimonadales bacterium]|nr:protein translocase subunit SecF [Candidatus Saccharimonadales bacterium]